MSNQVSLSSSGSIKMHVFSGEDDGIEFEEYYNRLISGLEYNLLEHTLEETFTSPKSKDMIKKGTDGEPDKEETQQYKDDHKARSVIKLTLEKTAFKLCKDCKSAQEMMKILKDEYMLGSKLYDHRALKNEFDACKLGEKENPNLFFIKLDNINDKFEKFSTISTKNYQRDAAELLMHIQDNVGKEYEGVWTALATGSENKTDEVKLKEAKLNLKEHWNKNHKPTLVNGEGDLIMNVNANCIHCGKKHPSEKCWKKFPHLRPQNKAKSNYGGHKDGGDKSKRACWICGGDHLKKDCPKRDENKSNEGSKASSAHAMFIGSIEEESDYSEYSTSEDSWCEVEQNFVGTVQYEQLYDDSASQALMSFHLQTNESSDGYLQCLGDTGAQMHVLKSDVNMTNELVNRNSKIIGCTGTESPVLKQGDVVLGTRNGDDLKLNNVRVVPGCSKNIISMTQLMSEGWIITSGDSVEMVMSYKKKHIVFKKLEKNLYYLEGKPGGNATEVNATVWDELTDDEMPDLFDRTYESSSSDDDSSDDDEIPDLFDRTHNASSSDDDSSDDDDSSVDDGMPNLVDRCDESSGSSDDDSDFKASDLPELFGENVYTSVFMDQETPVLSSTRSWADALLNKNNVDADAYVNNLNTTEGEKQNQPAVISDDEEEPEVVPVVPAVKKTVRILPDAEQGGALKIIDDVATKQRAKPVERKKAKKTIDVNQAHDQWGHQNLRTLKTMANILGYKLIGDLVPCDSCGVVKARRANVKTSTTEVADKPGMRVFVDTSGPFPKSASNNKYLHGMVDDFTGKMFMQFAPTKKQMVKFVEQHFKSLKREIKYVRMDGGGENEAIKLLCKLNGASVELTPPYTPKYNGKIERRFAVLVSMGMCLLWNAKFTKEVKQKLWPQAIETASKLQEISHTKEGETSIYEKWHGKASKLKPKHLVEFGRIGHVTIKHKKANKMEDRSVPMIMVGYGRDSAAGTYRMWNPKSKAIVQTDSVTWSKFKRWNIEGEVKGVFAEAKNHNTDGLDIDEVGYRKVLKKNNFELDQADLTGNEDTVSQPKKPVENPIPIPPLPTSLRRSNRLAGKEPDIEQVTPKPVLTDGSNKVTGDTTVTPVVVEQEDEIEGDEEISSANSANFVYSTSLNSDPGEPQDAYEAIHHEIDGEWWRASAIAEFNNFLSRNSWKFVPKTKAGSRKLIGTKMVFKKKEEADGTIRFKSRCVTKGYMQIPGVDFTEKFSPVATNAAGLLVIALILFFWDSHGWRAMGLDVEAAFLEGKLAIPMYLLIPKIMVTLGFISEEDYEKSCIELGKGMYGNVDAALKFFIELTEILVSDAVGMTQSKADPCVFYKKDDNGFPICIVVATVDDCLIAGKPDDIKELMDQVESRFKITRDDEVKLHLGVTYDWKRDDDGNMMVTCTMVKKCKDIVDCFEKHVGAEVPVYSTPGKPHSVLSKNLEEVVDIDMYRSLVGKIMFFATKVGPTICHAVRDLAAHMSNPGKPHWEALRRLVGYMKGMKLKGMALHKPNQLRNVSACDADYAKCPDTRKSIGGEIHTLGGCLTAFSSRGQNTVSMSSCESEYKSACSAAKEMKFQQMLLEEIAMVELPGIIFEDNRGTIFLVKNKQVSQRTKHIDVAAHFIREFCSSEIGTGKVRGTIEKIDTKENPSDICTKNTDVKCFEYHAQDIND